MLLANNYNPDVLTCLANLSNDEVFTPPQVVSQMLDMLPAELFRSTKTTFLDPVSKSGVFLREIAKRLMEGLADEIPDIHERADHIFTHQLFGIGITELTSYLSRRSVYCSKYANGRYSVCTKFKDEQGNIRSRPTEHTFVGGRCSYCGASEDVFGPRVRTDLESHAYEFIHTDNPEKLFKNMKFDVIIGNPPYQLNVGVEKENYAIPIYHKFIQQAKKLRPRYLTMIIPSRWFTGGRGLDDFRTEMLNDSHIKYIKDFVDSKDVFPGVDVAGGINFFLWSREYDGLCEYVNVFNGKETKTIRSLNEYKVFPRYNQALSIIKKAKKYKEVAISPMISSQTPFGFITTFRGRNTKQKNDLELHTSGGITYVSINEVTRHTDWVDKYKVIFSKATCEHAGTPDRNGRYKVFSTMKILKPNEICTQSYLVGGIFDEFEHAKHYLSYLKTAFVRCLMLPTLTSQDISADKFQFVPLQDFSHPWTDAMLYEKYGLTDEEIAFIESMIRPME